MSDRPWKVQVLKSGVDLIGATGVKMPNRPRNARGWMMPDAAMAAADRGDVLILSPVGKQTYAARMLTAQPPSTEAPKPAVKPGRPKGMRYATRVQQADTE